LITAEQVVLKNKGASFIEDYTEAIDKIKAVLIYSQQNKTVKNIQRHFQAAQNSLEKYFEMCREKYFSNP
jgi:hypothetical protein